MNVIPDEGRRLFELTLLAFFVPPASSELMHKYLRLDASNVRSDLEDLATPEAADGRIHVNANRSVIADAPAVSPPPSNSS